MPIYEYECDACGHADEVYQKISDDQLGDCPECGCPAYRKVPSLTRTPHQEYAKPIEMHSIALVNHYDIQEFRRRNPEIQCSVNPKDPLYGVPVAKSRAEKLKILDKEGWTEKS